MRIFVIGATGKTGQHIVDLALRRGHSVTAFVRSPEKMKETHARLSVMPGNPLSTDALAAALPGHDAVLSALGVRPPAPFRPHTLVQEAMASTVAAMTRAGVSRVVLVSAAVLFPERGMAFAFFRWLLQHIANDLRAAEAILSATDLAFTIARPPRLSEKTDEVYRSSSGALPDHAAVMSFRAVAAFMLDTVEQRTHIRQIVGLAR
jgi:uncharacterized protein YbjT (DUF2867 family)